ncbi:12920_t:CDS:2, partial [Racocetra persica]
NVIRDEKNEHKLSKDIEAVEWWLKSSEDRGLVFDKGKIIDRNVASNVYHNEVGVKSCDNEDKAADGRAEIVRSEIGSVEVTHDENIKNNKYHKFHDKKSCCDEYSAHDCESVVEIKRNQRDKIDDIDDRKMKREKNNYVD